MHWLEMKKPPSCPQCRRACPISKIIRLYIEEHIDVELDPSATSDELKVSPLSICRMVDVGQFATSVFHVTCNMLTVLLCYLWGKHHRKTV